MAVQVEDFEVHHEKDSMDFYVLLLEPHLLGRAYQPSSSSPAAPQFLIKFDYHINHIYYDIGSSYDIGTRRNTTLVHQHQEKHEKIVELEKPVLRKCGKSYESLSKVLSTIGIKRGSYDNGGLHDEIMSGIIKWGAKFPPPKLSKESPELWGLYVYIGKDHDMYRCDECLMARVTRKSMASKGMVSIKKFSWYKKDSDIPDPQ
ncbi:hypothetical protein ACE6H2_017580 [Prunus campanulata]